MTKTIEQMTDTEILEDERLNMSILLDRFTSALADPYEGREPDPSYPSLDMLRDAAIIQEWLDEEVPRLVDAARKDGGSWQQIGNNLGMTRQGAQQAYGS